MTIADNKNLSTEPSLWQRLTRRCIEDPRLPVSSAILFLLVLAVVVVPFFLPSATAIAPIDRLQPPSAEHPLGTDSYGRDILSRLVSGGRGSLGIVALTVLGAGILGTTLGLISGYYSRVGAVIMRILDAWMSFPAVILAMVFAVSFGASFGTELIALIVIFTPTTARVVRSRALALTPQAFVEAARVAGVRSGRILLTHILPNTLPLALVQLVIVASATLLLDGALSFLGLGIAPPTPTWGNMIAEGQDYLRQAPWLVLVPGIMIVASVAVLNMLGNALGVIVDPQTRHLMSVQRAIRLMSRQSVERRLAPRKRS